MQPKTKQYTAGGLLLISFICIILLLVYLSYWVYIYYYTIVIECTLKGPYFANGTSLHGNVKTKLREGSALDVSSTDLVALIWYPSKEEHTNAILQLNTVLDGEISSEPLYYNINVHDGYGGTLYYSVQQPNNSLCVTIDNSSPSSTCVCNDSSHSCGTGNSQVWENDFKMTLQYSVDTPTPVKYTLNLSFRASGDSMKAAGEMLSIIFMILFALCGVVVVCCVTVPLCVISVKLLKQANSEIDNSYGLLSDMDL